MSVIDLTDKGVESHTLCDCLARFAPLTSLPPPHCARTQQ